MMEDKLLNFDKPGFFTRSVNSLFASSIWHYPHYLFNQLLYRSTAALLKYNNYIAEDGKHPVWNIALGELSDQALEEERNVEAKLYFLGFRVMSVNVFVEDLKDFFEIQKRFAFNAVSQLGKGSMEFMAQNWHDKATEKQKSALMRALNNNKDLLWSNANETFQNLPHTWNNDRCAAQNFGIIPLRIIFKQIYGDVALPDKVFDLSEEYEKLWQDLDYYTPAKANKTIAEFKKLSQEIGMEIAEQDSPSKLKSTLENLQNYISMNGEEQLVPENDDFNYLGIFGITQNISRVMIGLTKVLSDETHMDILFEERQRLLEAMEERGIDPASKEALSYIKSHSEVYHRYFQELLRTQHVAPVVYRVNTSLFSAVTNGNVTLPARSINICPQGRMVKNEKVWEDPDAFYPERSEYSFEKNNALDPTKITKNTSQKPQVFGDPGMRKCPGQHITLDICFAAFWNGVDLKYTLTDEEKQKLQVVPDKTLHHAHLVDDVARSIKGVLTAYDAANMNAPAYDVEAEEEGTVLSHRADNSFGEIVRYG